MAHDLFDNFLINIPLYQALADTGQDLIFILYNTPGQAFTLYKDSQIYDNSYNANVIDQILFECECKRLIDFRRDHFCFLGIGFGASHLFYFFSQNQQIYPSFLSLIIANGIIDLKNDIQDALTELLKVFQTCKPIDAFDLFDTYFDSKITHKLDQTENMRLNPLTPRDRVVILNGILNSISLSYQVKSIQMPIFWINSIYNLFYDPTFIQKDFVPLENVELFCNYEHDISVEQNKFSLQVDDANYCIQKSAQFFKILSSLCKLKFKEFRQLNEIKQNYLIDQAQKMIISIETNDDKAFKLSQLKTLITTMDDFDLLTARKKTIKSKRTINRVSLNRIINQISQSDSKLKSNSIHMKQFWPSYLVKQHYINKYIDSLQEAMNLNEPITQRTSVIQKYTEQNIEESLSNESIESLY